MNALLIMNEKSGNLRVLVNLKKRPIERKVLCLIQKKRAREAFEILKMQGDVQDYLPPGAKLSCAPRITLIEDLL